MKLPLNEAPADALRPGQYSIGWQHRCCACQSAMCLRSVTAVMSHHATVACSVCCVVRVAHMIIEQATLSSTSVLQSVLVLFLFWLAFVLLFAQ
ncbi:hypothetical protein COO60DRAFT_638293 [Scenedesmus sp. NREL 46B-D3]|nr:hypothetical protein COO60DRAFT_638293 [Scenedesmus sp. NREL 46B-D3]